MIFCVAAGANKYSGLASLPWPGEWVPLRVHADGARLAAVLKREDSNTARVLTLYPAYPLEGGLDIYPELATGRFGLRVGPYLSDAEEQGSGSV